MKKLTNKALLFYERLRELQYNIYHFSDETHDDHLDVHHDDQILLG